MCIMTDTILIRISEDLKFIREELAELKEEVNDLRDVELEVRPEYLAKLKKIKEGTFKSFSSIDELRKDIEK